MSKAIKGLKPEGVWKYFAEISQIPRGSKNEAAIVKYVLDTAAKLGLEAISDKVCNVVVRKPGSAGREDRPRICLQGHLDMVCEKNKDKVHDFLKDPIELVVKGNVLMANGTTLGADNGIAVATSLALMAAKDIAHPPLEFLFTIDEETGLTGANNLEPGFLASKTLLNLDSEEEGALYVGCAGGRDAHGIWKLEQENAPAGSMALEIRVRGLKGGHSGLEIDKGRGNALKILTRVLHRVGVLGGRVASINGGNKHNAIPREAEALVFVPKKNLEAVEELVSGCNRIMTAELATVEPSLIIEIEALPKKKAKVLKKSLQKKVLQTITALPHGVVKMSADIAGLVETSTNVAVVQTDKKEIRLVTSQRSSVASEIDEISEMVQTVLLMGGAEVRASDGYPGWKPDMESAILKIAKETHVEEFGKEPHVKAIHAGLECGIIGEKYPGMDMVSFGPTLEMVHSPDEKIYIDTVERFWQYLLAILKKI
jgi:dipeptidase D